MIPPCEFDAAGLCKRHVGNPHDGAEQRMLASDPGPMGQAWRREMDRLHGIPDYDGARLAPAKVFKPCKGCGGGE